MATGVSKKNMDAPFIGIASSFSDLVPGHIGMRDLERQIEKGIHSAGGQAFIFGVPAVCDGIAMGHSGMRYSLPSRDLIADCVETVAAAHQLDGIVLLSNCDKITPGMLIGALRLNIPAIIVTAGPMLDGHWHDQDKLTMISGSFETVGRYRNGEITEACLKCLEEESCPSAGSCQGMYTANTMACLTEVMGMSLPYCASASAASSRKRRIAFESGLQIVELVKNNIKPADIITKASLTNAIITSLAVGGSTNTFLHLLAIANAGGIDITLDDFDRLSREIHQIVKINPSSKLTMTDFHNAGGIPAVMKSLKNVLNNGKTVSGLVANLYLDNTVSNSFVDSLEISGEPNAVGHVYGHILDGNLSASNLTYIGTVEWIGSFYDSDTMPALIEGTSDDGRIFYYGTLEAAKSAGITLSIIDGGVFGGDQTVTSNMTITLSGNATIPEGSTLTFEEGATIPSGKWVVNGIMVLQDQESLSSLTGATGSGNISINGKLYDPVTGELDSSAGDISWYDPNSTEAYEIGTAAQLIGFANLVNSGTDFSGKTVELTEDVDMEGYAFTPIGYMNDGSSYLRGTFDGNGNTVSNIDISSSGS